MVLLTNALAANATMSGVSGIALAAGFAPLSDWLGIPAWVSLVVGVGLLGFAIEVGRVARNPRRSDVLQVVAADLAWVVGAVVVMLVFPDLMSTEGLWALGVVTAAVALFAVLQTVGVGRKEATS